MGAIVAGNTHLAAVAARASRDAKGAPADLINGYLDLLVDVSRSGRRLAPTELEERRALGARAAERGVPLRAVVDIYLSATWLAWPLLPGVEEATGAAPLRQVGEHIFRAADASIVAVAEGYEQAQRLAIRREEAQHREFVDDLLTGRYEPDLLAERSQRYGLSLVADYVVAAVSTDRPMQVLGPTFQRVERDLMAQHTVTNVLVTTKDGSLVVIASGGLEASPDHLVNVLHTALGPTRWQVAVGRTRHGLGGIRRSFDEARSALDLAHRLKMDDKLVKAADLLVFEVLLRDTGAITELVNSALGPLLGSRLGAPAFIETLTAYFAASGVATVAARELHVGVRTVTHRLARIEQLTGYSISDPIHRYTLETAVLGARLLDWPAQSTR